MHQNNDVQALIAQVEHELLELQGHAPAWSTAGVWSAQLRPLEREERGARRERRITGERLKRRRAQADALEQGSGETWMRERLSATPWGVPKEVWRARRDREREVLDAEEELRADRLAAYERYLTELRALGDTTAAEAPVEPADVSPEELDKLWRRWRSLADQRAKALVANTEVRQILCAALAHSHEPAVIARAATPGLAQLAEVPRVPVVYAALALHAARLGIAGLSEL
jgi:hypothetical protein